MAEPPTLPTAAAPPILRAKPAGRRPSQATALNLDGRTLRAAQVIVRGTSAAVTRVAVAPFELASDGDKPDPAMLGQALAKLLEKLNLKAGSVVMGVPRQSVILRTLWLPVTSDVRELASMVHMQIGKDLPFRQDDAVIDFTVRPDVRATPTPSAAQEGNPSLPAGGGTSARLEVLVAAVQKATVQFYEQVARAAGVKLHALGWLSQANARFVQACSKTPENGAVALISLGEDEVGIDIVAGPSLLFSRGAAVRSSAQVESNPETTSEGKLEETSAEVPANLSPERFVEAVLLEVVRTLHSFGGMDSRNPVTRLLVVGTTGQEGPVLQALQERLKIPGSLLDPAQAVEVPESLRGEAAGTIGAIGLGLGVTDADGLPFDFLNPKRPAVARNMQRILLLSTTAGLAVLLFGFLGLRTHLLNKRLKIKSGVQAEVSAAQKKSPIYRQMQQEAAIVQRWTQEGRDWLEHYAYLSAVLPPSEDLYITSFSVSGQGNIHLAVQARSGEILANLDRQLRAAGYDVKPLAITPGSDRYGYNFRSTVELIVPPKLKVDLSKVQAPARPPDDGSLDPKRRSHPRGGAA